MPVHQSDQILCPMMNLGKFFKLTKAWYRTASPKKIKYLPSNLSRENPGSFMGVHTDYGWFLIQKEFWAPKWTVGKITSALEKELKGIKDGTASFTWNEKQQIVDDWAKNVDINKKPEVFKQTKSQLQKERANALYRTQLKNDIASVSPEEAGQKSYRSGVRSEGVTFIHAWNYFFSIMHPKFKEYGKDARKEISNRWNSMTSDQKEGYREAYADLLSQGKDIFRGKIVSREEKLKRTVNKKK